MKQRKGDWFTTYTGVAFYPLDPKPNEIVIEDIAHALSNTCRFSGHTEKFYSVAQHSVLVSELVRPEYKLQALLHDASEAYLTDIPRPLKPFINGYGAMEKYLQDMIYIKYGIVSSKLPKDVHTIDRNIVADEAAQLFLREPTWTADFDKVGITITPWTPEEAESSFLAFFDELTEV